uniref:ATP synthase complex subunit 8 n=2 Tax=Chaunax TaxID=181416 RepID=Q8HM36_CHAPG|nr:ATP synthase F0 subunit 8 [Chaunax pictus]BAC23324.1 ATPase subunit 8 [Chaunax penicillatus]BAI77044.1 ATPase subunit 8 [Chaunax pictus]
MPQLNPTPWLYILLLTWLIFLVVLPPKIMAHVFPNMPHLHHIFNFQTNNWYWPWR